MNRYNPTFKCIGCDNRISDTSSFRTCDECKAKQQATDLSNPTEPVKSPPEELELEAILEEHFIYQDNAQERMEIKQAKAQIQALIHQAAITELERLYGKVYNEVHESNKDSAWECLRSIDRQLTSLKEAQNA